MSGHKGRYHKFSVASVRRRALRGRACDAEWPAFVAIATVFVAGLVWVKPLTDVPVIDDWVYAWSVEHLLKTRELRVLEFSSVYPLAQILWGALFARIAGFSFGVLRLSTVVLAVLGCWALYLTLRELTFSRTASLLGALALALDPVYFALSFSFMTDVPFVALSTISIFYYVSALGRHQPARAWVGSLFAVSAFLIRPIGIAIPLAVVPALRRRSDGRLWIAPLSIAMLTMAVSWIAMSHTMGPLDAGTGRVEQFRWWFTIPASKYAAWNAALTFEAVFPLAPLLLASMSGVRIAAAATMTALLLVPILHFTLGAIPSPLPDWQTWSLQDIGARSMIGGALTPSAWSTRLAPTLRVLGVVVVGAMVVACVRLRRRFSNGGVRVLVSLGFLNLALINLLWIYNDRYYLVLAPALAWLALGPAGPTRRGQWVAVALLSVWAVIALSGTRDLLAFNDAAATAARQLEAAGVPSWEIDAGYAVNGWRLYAHPENLQPGADRRYDVPYVTSGRVPMFRVTNVPLPGYDVIRVVALDHAWWQVTDRLYVLRSQPHGT